MKNVAVVGAGLHKFGRFHNRFYRQLGREAVLAAIYDCNLDPKDVDAAYIGTTGGAGVGHEILNETGMIGIPLTRVENACVSGSNAVRQAWMDIALGLHDIVIAIGIEKMKDSDMATVAGGMTRLSLERNVIKNNPAMLNFAKMGPPGFFAFSAKRYIDVFNCTEADLASVVVKSRKNASNNPMAEHRNIMTVDDVLNDKMIAPPLTRSQCCPMTDGAACVVLMSEEMAKKYTDTPMWVRASTMGTSVLDNLLTNLLELPNKEIAQKAFKMAKLGPKDFFNKGFAEVHDCFSISEILHYEDFGWAKKGEGYLMVPEGIVEVDGILPINPSGGLLSNGHPLGATGVRQVCELLWQMRKDKIVSKRQVPDSNLEYGLTHTMGQPVLGWTGCIHIFSRDKP
ncbi:MAG: thiolase C-terminal domain-containing protein [Candidatus Helarchaeota archaeon]